MQSNERISEGRDRKKWILVVVALVAIAGIVAIVLLVSGGSSSGKGEEPPDEALAASAQTPEPVHTPVPFVPSEPTPAVVPTPIPKFTPIPELTPTPESTPEPEPVLAPTVVPIPKPTPVPISIPKPLARPTPTPMPTPVLTPTPEPILVSSPTPEPVQVRAPNFVIMEEFGDVLTSGSVELELPGRHFVDAEYTYQVKSKGENKGEFTIFFALYNKDPQLVWEILVRDYRQGEGVKNAEIIEYYADGAVRTTHLDREKQTMAVSHKYKLDPYPENIFSARSRSDLNKEELLLSNGVLNSAVKLNFDLSGFSDEEGMAFTQHSDANTKKAKEVEAAFSDIEALIAQIEEKR